MRAKRMPPIFLASKVDCKICIAWIRNYADIFCIWKALIYILFQRHSLLVQKYVNLYIPAKSIAYGVIVYPVYIDDFGRR